MPKFLLVFCIYFCYSVTPAQYKPLSFYKIAKELSKINTGITVLYIAAHPDDENTGLLAWLENVKHCRTVYLSLTRGEGGQNLIGTEQGIGLGLIRTEELLRAREIDGAEQRFTRAFDFGYSKSPEETFQHWNKELILKDVVRHIRLLKPDIIITRFPVTGEGGHGQHTASAIIAQEAFTQAANPSFYPDEFHSLPVWKTIKLFYNAWPMYLSSKKISTTSIPSLSINKFLPEFGKSINQIAAESRSRHKCQGMGFPVNWNNTNEYFLPIMGDTSGTNIFGNITSSTPPQIKDFIESILKSSTFAAMTSVSQVEKLYNLISISAPYKEQKSHLQIVSALLASVAGVQAEVTTSTSAIVSGSNVTAVLSFRTETDLTLEYQSNGDRPPVSISVTKDVLYKDTLLLHSLDLQEVLPKYYPTVEKAMYKVAPQELFSIPGENPEYRLPLTLRIGTATIELPLVVEWKRTDPALGELKEPLRTQPFCTLTPVNNSLFTTSTSVTVSLVLKSFSNSPQIDIYSSGRNPVLLKQVTNLLSGETRIVTLQLETLKKGKQLVGFFAVSGTDTSNCSITEIKYEHIPHRLYLQNSEMYITAVDFSPRNNNIAYIVGSGDMVPAALSAVGYSVSLFNADNLDTADLSGYKAVIIGIRAYNTHPELKDKNSKLNAFVRNGGKLIIQYQTADKNLNNTLGPVPFSISSERVTEELAEPEFSAPHSGAVNTPFTITAADFKNWVQERGLYFATGYSTEWTDHILWADTGEKQKKGALISAPYGKGFVVYTGISFFRQLPAGVPGALKLMINLIEADKL